jgi:dienelactone hydrolase
MANSSLVPLRPSVFLLTACLLACAAAPAAAQEGPREVFLNWVRAEAAAMRAGDAAPASLEDWQARRKVLRQKLEAAWGGFPTEHAPLEPRVLETLDRPDYRIEKIVFQTLPGVWMTANAWVPKREGKLPAVLCVHGHWAGAKQDPHVQARCAGLAKLGFFVLAVDAFGAGERGIGKALGEYHGEMTAATLWPIGRPLSGIQVYENMRAVDYLCSRSEVDAERLGITGASGGGNQSMYAGAWDERFKAVVPVCSVGTYQAYLGAACCMCEVVPGALAFTEESGVLSLVAPRALLVINATRDAFQFSVGEAAKSIAGAKPVFELHNRGAAIQHAVFESPHDYNQPMREAMYGFMTKHLKGTGDGSPIPEPALSLEEPEALRCYPGETRPDDWVTIPRFAAFEGRRLAEQRRFPETAAELAGKATELRQQLNQLLGDTSELPGIGSKAFAAAAATDDQLQTSLNPDPGIELRVLQPDKQTRDAAVGPNTWTLLVTTEGIDAAGNARLLQSLQLSAGQTARLQLRATGIHAWPSDRIGRAPDHNSAEWSLWIGRPLLGQWVRDIRTAITALRRAGLEEHDKLQLAGQGPAALAALCAAALDQRIDGVTAANLPATWVTDQPWQGQRLGMLPPGILKHFGDVEHVAALIAPAGLRLLSVTDGQGKAISAAELATQFQVTRKIYASSGKAEQLTIWGP